MYRDLHDQMNRWKVFGRHRACFLRRDHKIHGGKHCDAHVPRLDGVAVVPQHYAHIHLRKKRQEAAVEEKE